jgi:hypothetical protein
LRRPRPRRRGLRAPRSLSLALLATVAAVIAAAISSGASDTLPKPVALGTLPPARTPAFTPGPARALSSTRYLSHWAPVRRATVARAAPDPGAPAVARLARTTPEGTRNAVAVLGRRQDGDARMWVHVRLPVLPNGTTGWVRRAALGGYGTVRTHLDVDLRQLRATLYRDGRPVLRGAIGVGTASSPTPRGEFYIRNKLTRYDSPTYGPVAFGTSARSPTATDWPAGGFVGIHGTDHPELLPGRVSHGCIRMRDADVLKLAERMPVGTPLTIH